jgi:GH25 family lysozyme M1 (1,4-beta-N-acetylmuramidase)
MPWGAYFYTYSLSPDQDKSELNHILRLLKGKKPTLPIAIDVEDADNYKRNNGGWNFKNVNRNTKFLLKGLKKAGYYPILYTGFEEI